MKLARLALVPLAVIALAALAGTAQMKPDFSGVWTPVDSTNTAPPTPPPAAGGTAAPAPPPPPRTLSMTITQSATEMKVDRRVEVGGREAVSTFIYKLDGTESVNQNGPLLFRTKAEWQADSLVLSSTVSAGDKQLGDLKELYRLEGERLVVEGARKSPAGTFTSRTVHKKG
jgi:hypothetical protein